MRHENSSILELDGKEVSEFTPSKPREKWLRKRTHVKIRVGVKSRKQARLRRLRNINLLSVCYQDLGFKCREKYSHPSTLHQKNSQYFIRIN